VSALATPAPALRGRISTDPKLVVAAAILGLTVVLAVLAPVIAPHDPNAQEIVRRLEPPSASHWLGTDDLGRDVLSRLLVATRTDLVVGVLGALLPCLAGATLGILAGYVRGPVEALVLRLCDVVMAFPVYVLIISLVAVLGAGARSILIAFTVVGWVPYARLMRDAVVRLLNEDYIAAAYLGGLPSHRILVRHVLPNATRPLLAYVVVDVMLVILTVAAFSYLGLGIKPPTAEWGGMIADARPYLQEQWWLMAAPGSMIALVGLGFLLLGEVIGERTVDADRS
jgi:peptide/nickel transport system permease protein